jgi:hypothetical protein
VSRALGDHGYAAVRPGLEAARAADRFPLSRPVETHVLDQHRIALQELGPEARSGTDRIVRQLLDPPQLRIPLVLAAKVGAVVEHLFRRHPDIHAVLDDCSVY